MAEPKICQYRQCCMKDAIYFISHTYCICTNAKTSSLNNELQLTVLKYFEQIISWMVILQYQAILYSSHIFKESGTGTFTVTANNKPKAAI